MSQMFLQMPLRRTFNAFNRISAKSKTAHRPTYSRMSSRTVLNLSKSVKKQRNSRPRCELYEISCLNLLQVWVRQHHPPVEVLIHLLLEDRRIVVQLPTWKHSGTHICRHCGSVSKVRRNTCQLFQAGTLFMNLDAGSSSTQPQRSLDEEFI